MHVCASGTRVHGLALASSFAAMLVPIAISYDKVIEGSSYVNEMLGAKKTKVSLFGPALVETAHYAYVVALRLVL